ncbi:MAG TPA: glycosyltransferase [Chitinophagaceae bacterium]|nr:glycosyltransferase [Chitinophagaceae bacterium]HNF71392.1 glycosyltransferase [Chitinophagaceae bacterium]
MFHSLFLLTGILLLLCYSVLILYYRKAWFGIPAFRVEKGFQPKTRITLCIAARNEEAEIGPLLQDIQKQYYPSSLMEVIVVDDFSEDRTASIAKSFPWVRCLSLSDWPGFDAQEANKKKGISLAIAESSGELIVCTDADCRMGPYWLLSLVSFYEKHRPVCMAAPVLYTNVTGILSTFQSLDFSMMQAITAATVESSSGSMCNGANLAYTRRAWDQVGGYAGISQIASGDDMLLMHKMEMEFPGRTRWIRCMEAVVWTRAQQSIRGFLNQRIRWASKSLHYRDRKIQWVLLLVYLFNLYLAGLGFLLFWKDWYGFEWLLFLSLKTIVEMSLLWPFARFSGKEKELWYFPLLQPLHILYILYSGLRGLTGSYEWKQRTVR